MNDEFRCEARCSFGGKELNLNKIIAKIDIEEITPSRNPVFDPSDVWRNQERLERRKRLVDMIASEFAHALTDALYKLVK